MSPQSLGPTEGITESMHKEEELIKPLEEGEFSSLSVEGKLEEKENIHPVGPELEF